MRTKPYAAADIHLALKTWKRHRKHGTMPPKWTMEIIVHAAKCWRDYIDSKEE